MNDFLRANGFAPYRKTAVTWMRPWHPKESKVGDVSISTEDMNEAKGPGPYGMLACNPDNLNDLWYVARKYFEENYEDAD